MFAGGGGGGAFTSNYAKTLFTSAEEKTKITQKIEQLKALMALDSGVKIPEVKKGELEMILKQQQD